jgi:TonB family protein
VAGAIVLHAGTAMLAYAHLQVNDVSPTDGAPAIEVSMALESARADASDLPPGQETEASTASAAAIEQSVKADVTPLPQERPIDSEDPDRIVSEHKVEEKPETEPEKARTQTQASSDSVSSDATAAPTIESAAEAPRTAAPIQGTGQSIDRLRATWQKQLVAHLDRNKRYPSGGSRRNVELVVSFTLDRLGHVVSARVLKNSGDTDFDNAALEMMKRADPVPTPPPLIADEGLTFTLPVIFRAKGRS